MTAKNQCALFAVLVLLLAAFASAADRSLVVGVSDNCQRPPDVAVPYVVDALVEAGHMPLVVSRCLDEKRLDEALARVDLLVMTGGADVEPARYGEENTASHPDPARDAFDFMLLSRAVRRRLPIFGICRGNQLVNVFFGGSLYQDIERFYTPPEGLARCRHSGWSFDADATNPPAHSVEFEPGSRLAAAIGPAPLVVNSHHHQGVKRLAPGFRVSARAADGFVEAIECDTYPAAGVQFHPESLIACRARDPRFDLPRLCRILEEIGQLCESPATNAPAAACAAPPQR